MMRVYVLLGWVLFGSLCGVVVMAAAFAVNPWLAIPAFIGIEVALVAVALRLFDWADEGY